MPPGATGLFFYNSIGLYIEMIMNLRMTKTIHLINSTIYCCHTRNPLRTFHTRQIENPGFIKKMERFFEHYKS